MGDFKNNQQQETSWLLGVLISIDQLGNAIAGGNPRSTISARTGYNVRNSACQNRDFWKFLASIINYAFYPIDGPDHCDKAYRYDIDGNYREGNDVMRMVLSVFVVVSCVFIAVCTRLYTLFVPSAHYKNKRGVVVQRDVRQFVVSDCEDVINYFQHTNRQYLEATDGSDMPVLAYDEWVRQLLEEEQKSYQTKSIYYLIWQLADSSVGHANLTNIEFRKQAYLHLHLWYPKQRNKGNGSWFIKQSILHFFDKFELETLYCEPSLFNIPANKILAQLGFELLSANRALVTRLEHGKAINQWRLHRSALNKLVH